MKNRYQPGCCGCGICQGIRICLNTSQNIFGGILRVDTPASPTAVVTINGLVDTAQCGNCSPNNTSYELSTIYINGRTNVSFCQYAFGGWPGSSITTPEHTVSFCGGDAMPFIQFVEGIGGGIGGPVQHRIQAGYYASGFTFPAWNYVKYTELNQSTWESFCAGEELTLPTLATSPPPTTQCNHGALEVKVQLQW